MEAYEIITKPLLTEKSYAGIQAKVYTFVVNKRATKTENKRGVEKAFGVEVERVNTAVVRGNKKTQNTRSGRTVGKTSDDKKASVSLTEKSKPIAFFESLS